MNNNKLMEIPRCPHHEIPLIHREHPSADAHFCGTWYDCPQCGYSVLFPSVELAAEYKAAGKPIFHPNLT